MNFPRAWARLPGPADFLDTVFEDLTDRVVVFAGLPDEVPPSVLAVEMADLVKLRGLGTWSVVRSSEACSTAPSDSIELRIDSGKSTGLVLWIDATVKLAAATAWIHHATRLVEIRDMPRMFIAMSEACAIACGEEKRIRRRLWRDFVTKLDSRALVERIGRRAGYRPLHLALKSTLVAEIAGADLALAERLFRDPMGRLLHQGRHSHEKVWAAQVATLLPLVERERQQLLYSHQALWQLPHIRKDGRKISKLSDLEIGDMAAQAQRGGQLEGSRKRLIWLRRVRNSLAHNEVVPWPVLVSPIALQVMDFR